MASPAWTAPIYKPELIATYPHNQEHFTQGLFFYQDKLYESTGLYGKSLIAIKDPPTGQTLLQARLSPDYFGEGSAVADGLLYMLTWKNGACLILDADSLEYKSMFNYSGEGWGLTYDGSRLIRSDGSQYLYFHDLQGKLLGKLTVRDQSMPVKRLNELEWVNENLILANIWYSTLVAAIDPETGQINFWLDLADLVPPGLDEDSVANGLAIHPDGKSLWITGKLWPVVLAVAWPPK